MRWRLLLKEYRSKIVHATGITNTVADTISGFYHVSEEIPKNLDESDFINDEWIHRPRILSNSFQDNIDLSMNVGECFTNISEALEDIAFLTVAEIGHEQRAAATMQHYYYISCEHYCVTVIGNTELLIYDEKCLIIP